MIYRHRGAGLLLLLYAGNARAEPSATERATAEALFQQGTELMGKKEYAAACEKFAGSQQLDPAIGTMLRLADCEDRIGKSASAWAMFQEAASLARTHNEPDRVRIANERAADLEKRLSKLEIKVDPKHAPSGLEIKLNGVTIPRVSWDTPLPVDPGRQRIEASAPQHHPWSGSIEVPSGPAARSIEIPALALKPPDPVRTSGDVTLGTRSDVSSSGGSTQRVLGFVSLGLGVVAGATGGYLAYRAYDLNKESFTQCSAFDANACTVEGKQMRDDAQRNALGSNVAFIASGALVVSGMVLVLTARSAPARQGALPSVTVSASGSPSHAGVQLLGSW